jgi:Domain of unknown function (DUF4349)
MQKPLVRLIPILSIFALCLCACGAAATPAPAFERSNAPSIAAAQPQNELSGASKAADSTAQQTIERIVIKNGNLVIVVSDPAKSMETISKMADEMGGYVVSANLDQTQLSSGVEVPHATISIRVPAERLDEAMTRIKGETNRPIIKETVESQDITSQYTDLQSRLTNLENAEAQLTQIMDQATKTEDVLNVYNQLVSVQEQIEVLKGQIKYYDESAKLSAISTELLANETVQPLTVGGWQPTGIARNALQALVNTLKFLANAIIWILIYILPVVLVLFVVFFLPIYLIVRAIRRRRASRKTVTPPPPPPPPAA